MALAHTLGWFESVVNFSDALVGFHSGDCSYCVLVNSSISGDTQMEVCIHKKGQKPCRGHTLHTAVNISAVYIGRAHFHTICIDKAQGTLPQQSYWTE